MSPTIITPRAPRISVSITAASPKRILAIPPAESEFMELARRRFRMSADATNRIREEALDDLQFYDGKQWPAMIESDRVLQNRPCLTINRLQQFAAQILNAQRASRPSIQVNPIGDGADVETAEIIEGLTRHIEMLSGADACYDKAFEGAVIHGFGYFRILTAAVDPQRDPFTQEIRIARIDDPFSVYFDPFCREQDYSDAEYCFICTDIPTEIYKRMYPKTQVASLSDFRGIGDGERDWFTGGNVRVAEYFYVEKKKKTMVQLVDGRVVDEDELHEHFSNDDAMPLIVRQKNGTPMIAEVEIPTVHWCKINAVEKIEETDWAGRYIPVIPVLGNELIVEGKRKLYGIVRHAKDAQRQYNYMRTGVVEQIALATKAPWLIAEGQVENHEQQWKLAAVRNYPFLIYRPITSGGQPVPPPIRNQWEPPIQAFTAGMMQADADLKSTTGMFNPALGEQEGTGQSGVAIDALQRQGEQANSHFMDNLSRSIRHAGRIILDLVPKIYDTARVVRIIDPDQSHRMVAINGADPPPPNAPAGPQIIPLASAVQKVFDLTVGLYDVATSVGMSYQTRRKEFVASVMQLVSAAPQTFQLVGDLVVRHMDWPGAAEIADRLHKMLPPALQEHPENQLPPEAQAQIAALLQEKAQLVAALQKATNPLELARINNESRERISLLDAKVAIVAAELRAKVSTATDLAKLEYAAAADSLELWHETRKLDQQAADADAQRQHELNLAQQQQAQGAPGGSPAGPGAPPPPGGPSPGAGAAGPPTAGQMMLPPGGATR